MFNPTDSSLTRQAWAYQQKLIDLMGEDRAMGQADQASQVAQATSAVSEAVDAANKARNAAGFDDQTIKNCGKAIGTAAFVGFVAGKVGLTKTLLGVGAAYLVIEGLKGQKK